MILDLRDTLWKVKEATGERFSGVGVLVSDDPERLPILPLRLTSAPPSAGALVPTLAAISVFDSEFHDGFHIVSSDWQLTRVSQYFSPPIVAGAVINRNKLFGGRYLAALFGSALPPVRLAGIASRGFGIAIFEAGAERFFEPDS